MKPEDVILKNRMEDYLNMSGLTYRYQEAMSHWKNNLNFLDVLASLEENKNYLHLIYIHTSHEIRKQLLDKFFNIIFGVLLHFEDKTDLPNLTYAKKEYIKCYWELKHKGEIGNVYIKAVRVLLEKRFEEKFVNFLFGRIFYLED